MSAALIDGKALSTLRLKELKQQIQTHLNQGHRPPGLAVILVGEDPASSIYVNNKRKACKGIGIDSFAYDLPDDIGQDALFELIDELNEAPHIDGILIQLPLPKHINESLVIEHIKPEKDVDGFHPYNLGRLAQKNPLLRPCTPMGIMSLLNHYQLEVKGKHALVIGASNIVGRPMSLELLMAGATVTTAHRLTVSLQELIKIADILVVAAGVMDLVHIESLQKHQIVVDVGIHRLADGRIRGDVDFNKARAQVAWITPVPGGVGPMTVVSLLENTVSAARNFLKK